jgi:hypothetical protein
MMDNKEFSKQLLAKNNFIHSDIIHSKSRHSCESRNPEKHLIPGQARNDKPYKTYAVMLVTLDHS